jgi:hypothetical protein
VHTGLRRIIVRCLQKEPAHRYASAAEVRTALETVAAALEPEAGAAPQRGSSLRSARMWLAAAVLVIAVGAALWWSLAPREGREPSNFRLLSTFPGAHRHATISPDGSRLAFVDTVRRSRPGPARTCPGTAHGCTSSVRALPLCTVRSGAACWRPATNGRCIPSVPSEASTSTSTCRPTARSSGPRSRRGGTNSGRLSFADRGRRLAPNAPFDGRRRPAYS